MEEEAEEAFAEGGGELVSLRGQCSDGENFTVASGAIPIADGCYSPVAGTDFGEGLFYSTEDADNKRTIYPKVITKDGESSVSASCCCLRVHCM